MGGWNIWYALINFAILAAALYFIGRKIVVRMLSDNRRKIEEGLRRADAAGKSSERLEEELERKAEEYELRRREILEDAIESVKTRRLENEDRISRINGQIAACSDRDAPHLTGAMLSRIKSDTVPALLESAAELMASGEYEARRRALEAGFAEEISPMLSLTGADMAALRWNGELSACLTGADDVALSRSCQVQAAVDSALGRRVPLSLETDPRVIGGLRLQIGDTVYDGTLRGMLDRLGKDILSDQSRQYDLAGYYGDAFARADNSVSCYQVGHVLGLSEGICTVSGLSDVMAGEILFIDGGAEAMVMDIEPETVSAVLLGSEDGIRSGAEVRRTKKVMEVSVGEGLIGRVLNGIGDPIDGKGDTGCTQRAPVESPAPPIIARQPVSVPLQTGILAIDALVPIGRGQRELIIGDRQTGKTAIAVDSIINQKGKDVICIYVAIGQKDSTVAAIVSKLRELGAMDYTVVVNAKASDPAPMLYMAPYVGTAVGEYFMNSGRHVLIVYDDLSKHAVAYRELSLLLQRAPGREAYPGDVFYLHSRLLERSACLDKEHGGGSMTALPIVETQAGDISAYIPTNVISITDGQIFLDGAMFNQGKRPAINAGLSVSRVGGAAQPKAMKQFASRLRVDLAQHRELEAFSQFGSDLDRASLAALNRGRHVTQLLVQKRYSPMSVTDQVVSVFAVNNGFFDDVAIEDVAAVRARLCDHVRASAPDICRNIEDGMKLSEDEISALKGLIGEFIK